MFGERCSLTISTRDFTVSFRNRSHIPLVLSFISDSERIFGK